MVSMAARVLVAGVFAVAAVAVSEHAASPATPGGGGTPVPLVRCPTENVGGGGFANIPKSYRAAVPKALRGRLSGYLSGADVLVGPKGWTCRAIIGGDGGQVVTVSPPGQQPVSFASNSYRPVSLPYGLSTDMIPGCVGCMADLACVYFPAAAYPQNPCTGHSYPGEKVTRLSATAVATYDPPHVHGMSSYSGGTVAVYGTVIYVHAANGARLAASESCALPATMKQTCLTALAAFRRDHQHGYG